MSPPMGVAAKSQRKLAFFMAHAFLRPSDDPAAKTGTTELAIIEGFVWHPDFERSQRPRKFDRFGRSQRKGSSIGSRIGGRTA